MANYSAKILNNSVLSLNAQQALIAVTSNNISNVNTEGYSRRTIDLKTREGHSSNGLAAIGNGVEAGNVQRAADEYINQLMYEAGGDKSSLDIQQSFLDRAQKLFSLDGNTNTIGSALSNFFTAINDLSANPSSTELRTNLIQKEQTLVDSIQSSYTQIANLQQEADSRLQNEVQDVNNYTKQIADLNGLIKAREGNGQVAADERDQRDQLLSKLGKKISFHKVEQNDGTIQIALDGGFTLVNGSISRNIEYTATPSFAASTPPSLSGKKLGYIVYDYDPTNARADIDLTKIFKNAGGGTIGGLLKVRGVNDAGNTSAFQGDGPLVDIASRIEGLTRGLLTTFNQTYLGNDENAFGLGFQSNAGDQNGNPPNVYGLFDFNYSGTKDTNSDLLPNDLGSLPIDNFSSILKVGVTDPRQIAAARDVDPTNGVRVFPTGNSDNLKAISDLQNQQMSFGAGSFSFNGTYNDLYNELVGYAGNKKANVDTDYKVAVKNYDTAAAKKDEVSSVSLDEEFTGLIKYQKAYEASAKMVKVADTMLQQIIDLV